MKVHGLMILVVGLLIAADEKKEKIEKPPKEAAKPYLGVEVRNDAQAGGPVITAVTEGSPAAKGGLKAGDVVLKVGGKATKNAKEAVAEVKKAKVGDEVTFHVKRAGKEMDVKCKLGEAPK
jgi:S1-C subfamily serine protease